MLGAGKHMVKLYTHEDLMIFTCENNVHTLHTADRMLGTSTILYTQVYKSVTNFIIPLVTMCVVHYGV